MKFVIAAAIVSIASGSAIAQTAEEGRYVVTLYRNSVLDSMMRIHVATFDAAETQPTYNSENCEIAAKLFREQPDVSTRYWCEPGSYRKEWK